jgi:hypothetical protein
MSRLIVVALVLVASVRAVCADELAAPASVMSDQLIGASLGVAGGGRVTPGGLRITGHYLYQLTDHDWFDGTAAFTFGSGEPACFRDRRDDLLCDHSLVDGFGAELGANVRRYLDFNGQFWPYAKLGIGVAIVRFADDDVTGFAVPLHAGGGMRVALSAGLALTVEAMLDLGLGGFTRGLGLEPQLGASLSAGVEFGL